MPKSKRFTEGQEVFVVRQVGRLGQRNNEEPKTETVKIVKVGRKYAYIEHRRDPEPFDMEMGISHHPKDCNARANHWGFNVYESKEDYEFEKLAKVEYVRLKERLKVSSAWPMVDLPHDVVRAIHAILDAGGDPNREKIRELEEKVRSLEAQLATVPVEFEPEPGDPDYEEPES